jgi:hypothetical protein
MAESWTQPFAQQLRHDLLDVLRTPHEGVLFETPFGAASPLQLASRWGSR